MLVICGLLKTISGDLMNSIYNLSLSDNLLSTYQLVSRYSLEQSKYNYILMFASYLRALIKIGYDWKDAKEAYYKKLKVNHIRQETNY